MAAGAPQLAVPDRQRLCAANLDRLRPAVTPIPYARDRVAVGQVHLGVGAFFRAHTAVYTDIAIGRSGGNWGVAGVSLRQPTVRDQLLPQDSLYTVAVRDDSSCEYRLVGALKSVDVAPEDPHHVVELIADPAVRIVTLTVTEKGYGIAPDSGRLDLHDAAIREDIDDLRAPRTTPGVLVAGLRRRCDLGSGPVTIVSCDNLPGNGARLRGAVSEFAALADPGLQGWLDDAVRFPSTMVDRIVPATTDADIRTAAQDTGLFDAAHVKTEPFTQWVIEDDFAAGRPDWEQAGALLVDDVAPYETAKLRLLNGPHSALAYLGYLGGHACVHEAMQSPAYAAYARQLMTLEIAPVTPAPRGMQHATYIEQLLERFANSSLQHRTWQIAMDGSQKLPQRLLNTVRDQLRRHGSIERLSLAVAAWMRYCLGRDERGRAINVMDPLAGRFEAIAAASSTDAEAIVAGFLAIDDVFGADLPETDAFVAPVVARLRSLLEHGAARTVEALVDRKTQR